MNYDLLYKQYFDPIRKYLVPYCGEECAEELAQEVFLKVSRNLNNFRGDSSVKTWIYRIASNQAKDYLKSRYKKESDLISEEELEKFDSMSCEENSPEVLNITNEMNGCIKEFIIRLPHKYSAVLILSELQGQNIKEISEVLDISPNTTKVRLHRAKAKLRAEMELGCIITTTCDNRVVCERK